MCSSLSQCKQIDKHLSGDFETSTHFYIILSSFIANTMIFVVEALSVAVISGLKLTAWYLAFNWLAKY